MLFRQAPAIELTATRRNVFGELFVAAAVSLLVFSSALFLGGSSVAGSDGRLLSSPEGNAPSGQTLVLPFGVAPINVNELLAPPSKAPAVPQPPLQPADQPAAEPFEAVPSPTPASSAPVVHVARSLPTTIPLPVLPTATPKPTAEPVVAVTQPTISPPAPAAAQPVVQAASLDAFEADIVAGVNNERIAAGLAPLQVDAGLVAVARERSLDMASQGYFSHTSPNGTTAFSLLDAYGIPYTWAGENLARNNYPDDQSVAIAMRDWMASQGHRDNMLNVHYTFIGVGAVIDSSGIKYFTVVFTG
jgi:uncharacterized protein YkwD